MTSDAFAGLTLEELDDVAQRVVTCLEVDPTDPGCLGDAYKCARACLDLIDEHQFVTDQLAIISAQLDLVRKGRQS